ncbi:unnamed protein product [Victoria cruziana]
MDALLKTIPCRPTPILLPSRRPTLALNRKKRAIIHHHPLVSKASDPNSWSRRLIVAAVATPAPVVGDRYSATLLTSGSEPCRRLYPQGEREQRRDHSLHEDVDELPGGSRIHAC